MDDDLSRERDPRLSTEQMLQTILGRLERFPVERFVRMETELQQLRGVLEEESRSRKLLGDELRCVAREFGETMDKRMDRAFADCRQDRDLRLTHMGDRINAIQSRGGEEREAGVRMKIAVFTAVSALAISIVNAIINLLARR